MTTPHRTHRRGFQERMHRQISLVLRGPGLPSEGRHPGPRNPPPRPSRIGFLILVLCLGLGFLGCESQPKLQRGVLSGKVLDTAGNRVVGAVVTSHRSLETAETGKDGRYSFTSLDAGSHRVLVRRDGFLPASRTITIDFGQVDQGFDFTLAPLPNRISWEIFKRDHASVTIDVTTAEPMRCIAVYQGEHLPQMRTPPTPLSLEHRFMLHPLLPDLGYSLFIEGETPDGRRYTSATGSFRPLPTGDEPGAPPVPEALAVTQTREGPRLSWGYSGADPLKGFRVYRGLEDEPVVLWRDETLVFGNERSLTDEFASPGVRVRFALEALDRDGNVSSRTQEVSIFPAGELVSDVTWKQEWSPIDLAGDIQVPEGLTFTIEPGVTVRVSASDLSQRGIDPNICEVQVAGRLMIAASGTSPVRFISASSQPTRGDWSGIRINTPRGFAESEVANLEVNNARVGLLIGNAPILLDGFAARSCETGVLLEGASGTVLTGFDLLDCGLGFSAEGTQGCSVSGVTARGGETGILLRGNLSFRLRAFDLRQVRDTALRLEDTASASVRGGVAVSERLGVSIKGGPADVAFLTVDAPSGILIDGANQPDLRNCIAVNRVASGTGVGLEERTAGRSYPFNNFFGFQYATRNCDQNGGPILNSDPRFYGGPDASYDYHLRDDSPLKAAADNGGEMGAYGRYED